MHGRTLVSYEIERCCYCRKKAKYAFGEQMPAESEGYQYSIVYTCEICSKDLEEMKEWDSLDKWLKEYNSVHDESKEAARLYCNIMNTWITMYRYRMQDRRNYQCLIM